MSSDARGGFDPFATIVHLREDGRALPVAWTPDVFARDTRHRPMNAARPDG